MFPGRAADDRRRLVTIEVLQPLPLADRVIGQHDDAVAREVGAPAPVLALAARAMTGCEHDRRHAAGAVRRKVQIRRDPEPRQALVGDLLHLEAVACDAAEGLDLEVGRSLGNAADVREQLGPDFRPAPLGRSPRRDRRHGLPPRLEPRRGQTIQVRNQLLPRIRIAGGRLRGAEHDNRQEGWQRTVHAVHGEGANGLVPPRARRAPAGVIRARRERTPASRPRRGPRWVSARPSIDRRRRRRACPSPGCRRSASGRLDPV